MKSVYFMKKIKIFTIIFFIGFFTLVIVTGFFSTQSGKLLSGSWESRTVDRIHWQQQDDGGYSDIFDSEPQPYSSYYFTSCYELLGETPGNANLTHAWLRMIDDELGISNNSYDLWDPDSLDNLYFLARIMELTEYQPSNAGVMIEKTLDYQNENGSFSTYPDRKADLLDSSWGLYILAVVGGPEENRSAARKFLLDEWNNASWDGQELRDMVDWTCLFAESLMRDGMSWEELESMGGRTAAVRNASPLMVETLRSLDTQPGDLYLVDNYVSMLDRLGKLDKLTAASVRRYLEKIRNEDGGYDSFGVGYSESQGTYLALKIGRLVGLPYDEKTSLFVHRFESPSGGFTPVVLTRSSAYNTAYAVMVLKMLGNNSYDDDSVVQYLQEELLTEEEPSILSVICQGLKETGRQPVLRESQKEEVLTELENMASSHAGEFDLHRMYWLLIITDACGNGVDDQEREQLIENIRALQQPDGGFGLPGESTVTWTYLGVESLDLLGSEPENVSACIGYLEEDLATTDPYTGRGINATGKVTSVDRLYAILKPMQTLGADISERNVSREWLMTCRNPYGGYFGVPGGQYPKKTSGYMGTSMDWTMYGLEIEEILGEE